MIEDEFARDLMNGPCNMCGYRLVDIDADEKERKELRARVAELEAGIRYIIAYEWGKPEDGHEVAPSAYAMPETQKAWRALADLVSPPQGKGEP